MGWLKSHQYESFKSAITDLESKGKLKFWGRIGIMAEICYYTYITEGREYTLHIYLDGKVEVRSE